MRYDGSGAGSSGLYHAVPSLDAAYNALFNANLARLLLQVSGTQALLPEFKYDAGNDLVIPLQISLRQLVRRSLGWGM